MSNRRLFKSLLGLINVGPNTIARFCMCIRFSLLCWVTLRSKSKGDGKEKSQKRKLGHVFVVIK